MRAQMADERAAALAAAHAAAASLVPISKTMTTAQDAALSALDKGIHMWDFSERSYGIFGMQELFGPDLLFFILEAALRKFDLFEVRQSPYRRRHSRNCL